MHRKRARCVGVTCFALSVGLHSAHAQQLYWAQRFEDRIIRAELSTGATTTILEWPELDDAVGLALDATAGKIYWAQTIGDRIQRADVDGSSIETLVEFPEVVNPTGIALDIAGGKIYWAQEVGNRIRRSDLDGSNPETVVEWPDVDGPVSIAVDPAGGKIYWAQSFDDRIRRADLTGANAETLLEWPQVNDAKTITLDPAGGKMYWAQFFGDRVYRAGLDGAGVELLMEWPILDDAMALVVDPSAGKLYWAQSFDDSILYANLDGTNAQTFLSWPRVDDPVALALDPTPPAGAPSAPVEDPSGVDKSRFISFVTGATLGETALRVRPVSLHHVDPPYSGGPSVPFTSFEGQVRWVGPPSQYVESASSGTPFHASQLQCDPYYHDWNTIGLLHVTGSAIAPSSTYEVETLASSCLGNESNCAAFSTPLSISTTRWGDVVEPFSPPSTTAQPDFGDIAALVNKFKSALGAPVKARSLLAGTDESGVINIAPDLGFTHISACVDAFKGLPYPYTNVECP